MPEDYPTKAHWRSTRAAAPLLEALRERAPADHPALVVPGGHAISYGELADAVDRLAGCLSALGVPPAERIAVVADNSADAVVTLLAAMSHGICCPVDPRLREEDLGAALARLTPTALITGPGLPGTAQRSAASRGIGVFEAVAQPPGHCVNTIRVVSEGRPGTPAVGASAYGEIAVLLTSGTTGTGKLVPLPAHTMMAAAGATCRAYGLTANDRRLNIMPFHHIQGLVGSVLASLLCGSSVVCAPAFDPAEVPRLLREYDITWFSGSPTMHQQILEAVGRDDGPRPPMLRFVRSGSAPLPSVLRDRLQAAFGVPIIESYGMTEAHQIASDPVPPSPPVAGMAPTGCDIAIRGTAGAISAEPGRLGEVVIRGTNVIPGYLGDDDSNAACFVDGWFRTGDVGTVAEDGSLLIEGRIKDMINRGGEKILPQEIEHTLARHPRVRQAAVLGLPHTELIEEVVAVVVPADGDMLDPAELRRFLASRLAPFKVPSRVFYLSSLPLTATGKIARASLRDLLADAVEQESLEPGPAGSPERATAGQPTPYEAAVSGMWAAALGVGTVGLDDDFFALGGDSLAAVKLLRMIHETLAAEFSPLALYEEVSTVAKMAKAIQERQRAGDNGDEANPPQRKDGRAL